MTADERRRLIHEIEALRETIRNAAKQIRDRNKLINEAQMEITPQVYERMKRRYGWKRRLIKFFRIRILE